MSWTANGSLGTATSKVSNHFVSLNPSSSVPVGDVIIVWSAWDNQNGSTQIGELGVVGGGGYSAGYDHVYPVDTKGNLWWTIGSGSETGIDAKTHTSLFLCQVQQALTPSDTITLYHLFPKTAKAMSAEWFSLTADEQWATYDLQWVKTNGADPAAISLPHHFATLPSREYLMLHALGAEGPATDTYTWDADYTQITSAGTTGGSADSNQTISGGYRIATLTGDTVDVTSLTADRDYGQLLVALGSYTPADAFPTTAILDDFNRADGEHPLDNGTWDTSPGAAEGTANTLSITANEAYSPNVQNAGQLWAEDFGHECDMEVYLTMTVPPAGVGDWINVHDRQRGSGYVNTASMEGVGARWHCPRADLPQVLSIADLATVHFAPRALGWAGEAAAGTKIGVRRHEALGLSALWVDAGSGWTPYAAWYTVWPGQDPTEALRIGMNLRQASVRADDFGGGCAVIERRLPQIYRWIRA